MNAVPAIAQNELAKAYRQERRRYEAFHDALGRIVEQDFPVEALPEKVTRPQVDALRDLTNRIAALVEGWRSG